MSLKFTASTLSRIKKPGASNKSPLSPLRKAKEKASVKKEKKQPLEALLQNVSMDFRLRDTDSVRIGVNSVLSSQWAECTIYHERYYTRNVKESSRNQSDLLFLLRGISMEAKAEIIKYRAQQLPRGGMVTINQLYSLFDFRGNTYVDQSLELCVRGGQLRKFVITNALPVILRNVTKLSKSILSRKVTYGYENTEVVARVGDYLQQIDSDMSEFSRLSHFKDYDALNKFKNFVQDHPGSNAVTNENFSSGELKSLVETGYLTLTSNHHNEIDVHQYSIAFPRCGTFLKMINSGRVWLVQTLSRASFREMLENAIFEKWEGKRLNNFRRPFYGYDLLWILADAKGAGVVEVFSTPVGKAWRLTGKL